MEFSETESEQLIRKGIREITGNYGEDYWRQIRNENEQPDAFRDDLAANGWYGLMIPEEYGGQGLGLSEMTVVAEELGRSGGGRTATNLLLFAAMYGGGLLPRHGSDAQKETWLPKLAAGEADWAIGVTEPDAGLNTTNIQTTAEPDGDGYVLNGQKVWTTGIDTADRVALLARTMPKSEAESRGEGLTIFLVDPAADGVDFEEIPKDVYHHHSSFSVFIDDVRVSETAVLGEVHQGLYHFFKKE